MNKPKVIVLCGIILISSISCSWSTRDKTLFGTYTAMNMVDIHQTYKIFHDGNYYEINPMLDGQNYIPMMIMSNLLLYYIADTFPKARPYILTGAVGIKAGLVGRNLSIGLGW